ncbi:MAG: porin [Gemmatimonadota bacterium]|nr:porin [Gemmatimonadota bacterium]
MLSKLSMTVLVTSTINLFFVDVDTVSAQNSGVAGQDSIAEHIKGMEERLEALEGAVDGRGKNGHGNSKMSLHGRIHLDYWAFPKNDSGIDTIEEQNPQDRFAFRRVRLGVKGDVGDNVFYRITIEFANPNSTEYRDIFFGIQKVPFFQKVQIGNQKRPYSLLQLNSSNANVFIERPFIADATQQDTRRIGIQSWSVSANQAWNWQYCIFNRENTQNDGRYLSDNYQLEAAGRLAGTVYYDKESGGRNYAHLGIAGSIGWTDEDGDPASNTARLRSRPEARSTKRWLDTGAISGSDNLYLLGLEGLYNMGPFQVAGEFMNVRVKREPHPNVNFWGAYAYASYFLTGEHIPWSRKTGTLGTISPKRNLSKSRSALQAGVRYSYANFNSNDVLGGEGKSLTFGLNWWWNPNTRVQFNYIHGEIINRLVISHGNTSGAYDIIGTRFMIYF